MRTTLQVVPTMNEWDAPVYVYTSPEGRTQIRRDEVDPGDEWAGGRGGRTSYPHAVVTVDGVMSAFDRERQPARISEVDPVWLAQYEEDFEKACLDDLLIPEPPS